MKKLKLNKSKRMIFYLSFLIMIVAIISYGVYFLIGNNKKMKLDAMYISSDSETIPLINSNFKNIGTIYRGVKVNVYNDVIEDEHQNVYIKISQNNEISYINKINLTNNKKSIIQEKKVYVRTSATLYQSLETGQILSLAKKGDELEVLNYDTINNVGKVNAYQVKTGEMIGYIYQKYVLLDKEEALKNYDPTRYYDIHNNRGNRFGGGYAGNLDYYPVEKPSFKDNVMPKKVYALYLNNGHNTISNVDAFIEYAKTTKINAFVVDIKDSEAPGYKSKIFNQYSPTNYAKANNSFESYKEAIKKIKDAGFYVIGRITVFKDKYYCIDNPNAAIMNTQTNQPYLHNDTYWPSPYQRSVWEFNVNLAKEAITEMGFNEIQFDYVRFPDRTGDAEKSGIMNFKNDYNEEKAQAIQRFIMYATDEIHKLNAYISVDVFGESAYTYVTAYGQYWPAISNIVDVISGMPYPDHFNQYEFNFKQSVWTTPYELLYHWGSKYVIQRQQEIPTPAIIRTWVAVYDAKGGAYPYGITEIDAEIRGLFDAGLTGGYMTWLSYSSLDRYKSQKGVYDKEY
jgi:hypothetical protein